MGNKRARQSQRDVKSRKAKARAQHAATFDLNRRKREKQKRVKLGRANWNAGLSLAAILGSGMRGY